MSAGNPYFPKSATCRLIAITSYIFSLFLIITYSGTLTSFIAVKKPVRPFDSLETFLTDGTYTMEQIAGTAGYTYFSVSALLVCDLILKIFILLIICGVKEF